MGRQSKRYRTLIYKNVPINYAPPYSRKGGLEKNLLSRLANPQAVRGGRTKRKCVLFVWQFSIFGGVGNERKMKKFPQITVNFALRGVVGIRGRNVSAALAESLPRPSRVSENSMRNFRRNATNQPRKAG